MLKKSLLLLLLVFFWACATPPEVIPPQEEVPIKIVGSPIEITLSGIGSKQLTAGVRPQALGVEISNRITLGNAIVRSSTDIVPLGQPRTAGYRYLHVTLPISILEGTFTNLTFMAMNDPKNGFLTAVSELSRYPGLAAYTQSEFDALAASIQPTSPITLEPFAQSPALVPNEADTLQIYLESEISSLTNVLPYGFVAHKGSSRTISGTGGTITIAMRVPLQALARDDPYTIKLRFGVFEDSTKFITESLEAQLPNNQAAFEATRTRVGGSVRVMPGTKQSGEAICQVRIAGTSSSPTAFLVNRVPDSISIRNFVMTKEQTLALEVLATDANGSFVLPASGTPANASIVSIGLGKISGLQVGTTSISASACGLSQSKTIVVRPIQPLGAGFFHSLAVKSDNVPLAWGWNQYGQVSTPAGLSHVIAVEGGLGNSLALKQNGSVVAWGDDPGSPTSSDIAAISAGYYHTVFLKTDGTVVVYSKPVSNNTKNIPSGLQDVIAIYAAPYHVLALKQDGTVVAWGNNSWGQSTIPDGLSTVIAIGAGERHSLALKADGTVIAWGENASGKLDVPLGLSNVIAISAGRDHSLALNADGTVVAWGDNPFGQTDVPNGLTGVVAIRAGAYFNLALKQDGSIIAWAGRNRGDFGQLNVPSIAPLTFKIP